MHDSKLPVCPLDKFWNYSINTPLKDQLLLLSYANSQHLFIQRENSQPFYLTPGESAGPEDPSKGPTQTVGEKGEPPALPDGAGAGALSPRLGRSQP